MGTENVNLFAVVLEATFPHKTHKSENYVVSLKIADPTCKIDSHGVIDYISLICFAKKFDDLPVSQRCGEIIRIHRANVGTFAGKLQITANMCYNSSWALFHPQSFSPKDEFIPRAFFGKSFQMSDNHNKVVRSLRKWCSTSFEEHPMLSVKYLYNLSDIPTRSIIVKEENGKKK